MSTGSCIGIQTRPSLRIQTGVPITIWGSGFTRRMGCFGNLNTTGGTSPFTMAAGSRNPFGLALGPRLSWGPSWVFWRHAEADATIGWAPLPPGALFVDGGFMFNGVAVGLILISDLAKTASHLSLTITSMSRSSDSEAGNMLTTLTENGCTRSMEECVRNEFPKR